MERKKENNETIKKAQCIINRLQTACKAQSEESVELNP